MGFMDKLNDAAKKAKDAAGSAAQKAQEAVDKQKQASAERKEAKAQLEAERLQKAADAQEAKSSQFHATVDEGKQSLLKRFSEGELLDFTKNFYERIYLPCSSAQYSKMSMGSYIDEKRSKKLSGIFEDFNAEEDFLFAYRFSDKTGFAMSTKLLYYKTTLAEDEAVKYGGKFPAEMVQSLAIVKEGETYQLFINGSAFLDLPKSAYEPDTISLKTYFEWLEKGDFEITDKEVQATIKEKLDPKVYQRIRSFMDEEELIIYVAWGLDSLSAKDYLVCTTAQIIIMDREMFGMGDSIKQFYYEDITSVAASNVDESLLLMALTSALQQCDMTIYVAGTNFTIQTLTRMEVDRITTLFNQYKRAAKKAASQPQVVVQQTAQVDVVEQIKKLNGLKEAGILSDEEFNAKKAELLAKM